MKNKILFLGSLCLVMVIGLVFVGCQNEVQTIELGSVSAPKNVVAVWEPEVKTPVEDAHNPRLLVTWDAASANDVSGYTVVIAQEGSKNWVTITGGWIVPPQKSSTISGNTTTYASFYPDFDKYKAEIYQSDKTYLPGNTNDIGALSGTFKIGVYANTRNTNHKKQSKVVWSKELVTIPVYTKTTP
jgi:hypothetical protein